MKFRFEELASSAQGAFAMGPFGSSIKRENFVSDGVPVIRGGNLSGSRLLEEGYVFLTKEKADQLSRSKALPGDIVITHRGTLGQVAMIPRNSRYPEYVVSQSQLKLSLDESIVIPEYLTYWLKSPMGQHSLMAFSSQTGVPALSQPLANLKKIELDLPPMSVQLSIATTLEVLENKFESNRKIIGLLEQIIEAEFTKITLGSDVIEVESRNVIHRLKIESFSGKIMGNRATFPIFDQGSSGILGYTDSIPEHEVSVNEPILLFGDHTCSMRLATETCHLGPNLVAFTANEESSMHPVWLFYALKGKQSFQEYRRHWMELLQQSILRSSKEIENDFVIKNLPLLELIRELTRQNRKLQEFRDYLLPRMIDGLVKVETTSQPGEEHRE